MAAAAAAAQDEFNDLLAVRNTSCRLTRHPDDDDDYEDDDDACEETAFRAAHIQAVMRSTPSTSSDLKLPPASFDSGCATGVKGVIADACAFQTARRSRWIDRAKSARKSLLSMTGAVATSSPVASKSETETDDDARSSARDDSDEDAFLQLWRESRRRELESGASRAIRNRRTSPSLRVYGRLDEVDALGYLDAIEKVGRETKVVVFVSDYECDVSATIESALQPLVKANPTIHFVKVHYDDIEFDPAAAPSLLVYRNQGDMFANLTGLIEMMPDSETFDSDSLEKLLRTHGVL